MSRYTPPTIESYGGIDPYLDATKDKHNGYSTDDLKKNWKWGKGKHMNIQSLAVMFGVSWPTMDGWIDMLHAAAGIPRPDKQKPVANDGEIADNAK